MITNAQIDKKCEELGLVNELYYVHVVSGYGQLGRDWAKEAIECGWGNEEDGKVLIEVDAIDRIKEIIEEDSEAELIYWANGGSPCQSLAETLFDAIGEDTLKGWNELSGSDLDYAISLVEEIDWVLARDGGPWRAIGTCVGSYNNEQLTEILIFW